LRALIDERIADALASERAQLDQRLAAIEAQLGRLLVERPSLDLPSSRAEQLIALIDQRIKAALDRDCLIDQRIKAALDRDCLIDQRIKAALDRDWRQRCEATADVARDVLAEFVGEFRQVRDLIDAKLAQMQLLAERHALLDPQARPERPN
jgi:hypothetical protein